MQDTYFNMYKQNNRHNHLIVLAGPTGIGKTSLGIVLAKYFETEIVSCDSRQVFKEMRVGTAVPTTEELAATKHYFIQTHTVHEHYNASKYEQEALTIINELHQKYDIVFMVGGSGMYIDAVCNGIDDFPEIDFDIRQKYAEMYENEGLKKIQQLLKEVDPVHYQKVDLNNYKRILKALEITEMTGKPYSSQLSNTKKERPFKILKIALDMDRNELYKRINQRVLQMMGEGLEDEARNLYPYRENTSLKTVGYRELFEYFDKKISLEEAVEQIQNHSRAYARRQLTWLRRDKDYHWFHPGDISGIKAFISGNI